MKYLTIIFILTSHLLVTAAKQSIARDAVAVLYNSNLPESKELAEFYASKRGIPAENMIGIPLSDKEIITRKQYVETIQDPLRKHFTDKGWWELSATSEGYKVATRNKIQVLVCMYGVPYGIKNDNSLVLPDGQQATAFTKFNRAAVDSELAVLSVHDFPIYQLMQNKYFKQEVNFEQSGNPFYLLVGRIDSNSLETCKRMIDDAIETEKNGLWGMSYLDLSKKGSGYKMGDDWITEIEEKNWKLGIPTTIDKNRDTYLTNYPMRDAAMYFGWYTRHANGPFLNDDFKLRKGAVAVHLHSFSARNLRKTKVNWVGPLLEKGAAATVGNVFEPYLGGTHHLNILHDRLTQGYTLVESAYMAVPLLSWQNVVIGDPLYQPYKHLDGTGEVLVADKFYRACNMAFKAWGKDIPTLVRKMRSAAHKANDSRYFETIGLFRRFQGKPLEANMFFSSAKKMSLLMSDKTRNELHRIDLMIADKKKIEAIIACKALLIRINDTPEAKTVQAMLNILSPPPPPPAQPNKKIPAMKK